MKMVGDRIHSTCAACELYKDNVASKLKPAVFGGISVHPTEWIAEHDGKVIRLTNKEWLILGSMARKAPLTFTRDAMFNMFYEAEPNGGPDIKVLDVYMSHLRKKLKLSGAPVVVVSVNGLGYRLENKPTEAAA